MLHIRVRNVNQALPIALHHLKQDGERISPRGQETLEYPSPVCTTYLNPQERVLFEPLRDANPFFHLFESLWIIGGREDVHFLTHFNKRMSDYSDNGEVFHAPYGYRLRHQFLFDQIEEAVALLKRDPDTRQCVLQIWSAELDLNAVSKDIPCNDMVFLKIRNGLLNITVANRSNDVIWGAYGANVVQFSMLQEYIADRVGVGMGVYRQVSDSFHVYTENPQWALLRDLSYPVADPYEQQPMFCYPLPIGAYGQRWDDELAAFLDDPFGDTQFKTAFFDQVVQPLAIAWAAHKAEKRGLNALTSMVHCDWHLAAAKWLQRRETPQ